MNKSLNNFTLGFVLTVVGSLMCLFLQWGTVKITSAQGMDSMFNGREVAVTGTNGSISFVGISTPTWFICLIAIIIAIVGVLKLRSLVSVPQFTLVIPAIYSIVFSLFSCYIFMANGSVGFGSILMTVVAVANVFLVLWSPRKSV